MWSALPEERQAAILDFIAANFKKSANSGLSYPTSYKIKHVLEKYLDFYVSNEQAREAMVLSGFTPYDPESTSPHFNVTKRSARKAEELSFQAYLGRF